MIKIIYRCGEFFTGIHSPQSIPIKGNVFWDFNNYYDFFVSTKLGKFEVKSLGNVKLKQIMIDYSRVSAKCQLKKEVIFSGIDLISFIVLYKIYDICILCFKMIYDNMTDVNICA